MGKSSSKQIVIASATTLVVGAFGAGAFALAQADPAFDPQDFASAYSRGYEDAAKGYKANPIDADGQANRNKDDAENDDAATEGQRDSQDAFSDTPQEGPSGTTAYNVTGNVEQGGIAIVNNAAAGAGGSGAGNTNASNGPVIAPAGGSEGGNSNAGNNGNSGDNSGNQGGSTDPTPTPNPNEPTTPERPWVNPLPNDPDPSKSSDTLYEPVNDSNTKLANVIGDTAVANIVPSSDLSTMLYVGQTIDAWKVFCALEASFMGIDTDFNLVTGEWRCSQDQFDDYPYFKIVSFPTTVPSDTFDIEVAWRLQPDAEWRYETVSYEPAPSRTYVVSTETDENGKPIILPYYTYAPINLFFYTSTLMKSTGIEGEDGSLSKLLLSWTEEGKDVDYIYTPEPGRHVIEPGKFVDVPDGYAVKLRDYWLNADYSIDPTGKYACSLQTLTDVDGSASCMLVPDMHGRITLTLPRGVQAVDIAQPNTVSVDWMDVPDSLWYINTANGNLSVKNGFSVSKDNPNYASLGNGILTNKRGTEYLGIPLGFQSLDVAEGVQRVSFTAGNKLEHVVINAAHTGEIPSANWENLHNCNIVVDDDVLEAFAAANQDVLTASTGNTVSAKSNPQKRYRFNNGNLISDDEVVRFMDTGADLARVSGAHRLTAGCLDNCPNITTLVLTDSAPYTFDEGCLADSSVRTIVCSTEEQEAYVTSRLEAAGANEDVFVTNAATTDEGYRYFVNVDSDGFPATTIFEVPDSTRTFNGVGMVDDDGIGFSVIAPGTFENHPNIEWVNLADSVDRIGANAFKGCSQLQGVFISNSSAITVGVNAFANCPSMRFVASNAHEGDFASTEKPNDNCLMYAPTGCVGYHDEFTSFSADSNVSYYSADMQEDGSFLLYGSNDAQGLWLLLAAGSDLPNEVKLSPNTVEIFKEAFRNAQGNFSINWDELTNLQFVDTNAFTDSSLSGDVYIGTPWTEFVFLDDSAFAGCSGMTSFASDANLMRFGDSVFAECTSLESARFSANDNGYVMMPGQFSGCASLHEIEFGGHDPIKIGYYAKGLPFLFDATISPEEESAKLHLEVPAYYQTTYLEKWLYLFAGYADYDDLYFSLYMQMIGESDIVPTDTQVKQRMSQTLLVAENRLRTMMGMPLVERSSFVNAEEKDGYTFNMIDGVDTLVSTPEDAAIADLDAVIPDSLSSIAIGENAFSTCTNLQRVIVSDKVGAIDAGAFDGCEDVTVQLPETVCCNLKGGAADQPFTFGGDIKLDVPAGSENAYLAAWTKQCLGILSDDDLESYALDVFYNNWDFMNGEIPTAEEFNEKVNEPFVAQENYLRSLMGLDPISGIDELAFFYDASYLLAWFAPWESFDEGLSGSEAAPSAIGKNAIEAVDGTAQEAPLKARKGKEEDASAELASTTSNVADEPANLAADAREGLAVKQSASLTEASALPVFS